MTFRFCEAVDHRRRDGHPEQRLDELDRDRIDQTRGLEHLVRILRRRTDRGLEERGHLGLEPRLRLELAEALDQLRGLDERVVRDRRHRRVAAPPANAEHERRAHLLGRRREVERLPGELDPIAGALVDRVLGANGVRMLPAEPREPEVDADLLVGGRDEDHVALRLEALARERRHRDRARGHLALHVERAASPDLAVAELAGPRIELPLGRIREHRVRVREEREPRPVAAARDAGDEVRALREPWRTARRRRRSTRGSRAGARPRGSRSRAG